MTGSILFEDAALSPPAIPVSKLKGPVYKFKLFHRLHVRVAVNLACITFSPRSVRLSRPLQTGWVLLPCSANYPHLQGKTPLLSEYQSEEILWVSSDNRRSSTASGIETKTVILNYSSLERGREGGSEGGRKRGREGGSEGGRERERERERGREGGGREGGREGGGRTRAVC